MQSVPSALTVASDNLPPEQPYKVIRPGRSASLFNFQEVWLYRDLIMALAIRDIKLRYRQTLLGAIWVVLQPLLAAGIFSIIFNGVAKLGTDGVNPYVFTFSGMIVFNVFSSIISKTSNIMVANSTLVSKVYFPRICLPLSVLPSVLVDFGISFLVMAGLMIYVGVSFSTLVFLWPLVILLAMVLALGIGLISSSLSVTYRDIQYIVPVIVNMMMYASPIAYSVSEVTKSDLNPMAKALYFLNPFVDIVATSRYLLMGQGDIRPIGIVTSVVVTIVIAFLGLSCFRALERKFADVI
jgi:lipopolysaccharide transport system permease protein